MMLKVWGRRSSINVQKVLWLVGELALEHEHIPAGGSFGRLDEPGFRALNPHGTIPLIEDGDAAIWESHSILRYLAARYGADSFWSEDPAIRSQADRWMDWYQATLAPAVIGGLFWGFYRTPEPQRNWKLIRQSVNRCAACFRLLDTELAERPYLAGASLSLGDIPAATSLFRYFSLDIPRPPLPNVEAWYARLQERPAYRAHVMVPFDELKGRLDF
jgi:glutathione S-transferase